jgi:hypothetical protein
VILAIPVERPVTDPVSKPILIIPALPGLVHLPDVTESEKTTV